MLLIRGFERVLCDLSEIGYDAEWQCLSGTDFGIQQGRERLYCIAYSCEVNGKRSIQESIFREPYLSGNIHEYIRDGEQDSQYPHPDLLESLMNFPIGWTERSV